MERAKDIFKGKVKVIFINKLDIYVSLEGFCKSFHRPYVNKCRNLTFQSSGGQKSEVAMLAGLYSVWSPEEDFPHLFQLLLAPGTP